MLIPIDNFIEIYMKIITQKQENKKYNWSTLHYLWKTINIIENGVQLRE